MLPLFSAWSATSWGIGDFSDIGPLAAWAASAGFDRLMLLPLGTLPDRVTSPYSAMTSMAIDPSYIAVEAVEDFSRAGGIAALSTESRHALDHARAAPRVRYDAVRHVKREALALAFERFMNDEWGALTLRAAALAGFIARERWWLDDYAIYVSAANVTGQASWRAWPPALRDRQAEALDDTRRQLSREILQQQYYQWLAESQWQGARRAARDHGVTIFGDLPFMVNADSPDVWARPGEYMFDVSLGVPPDAFSETGQDWDLPTYRWDAIAAGGYAWVQDRARRMAALFDGYRVDHLVGLYRTYGRPVRGEPFFNPAEEADQRRQGEHILQMLARSGPAIIAEDLGVVPDFVRDSLARLGVPGTKVLRWERRWNDPGHPFADPRTYPALSAAMTGTHDTATLAGWWESAAGEERAAWSAMLAGLRGSTGRIDAAAPWDGAVRDALLAAAYAAGSAELFVPVQDVFGWRDRINTPATVSENNWSWRLPWPVDRFGAVPEAVERAAFCRALAGETAR
jgi:4-alpha-glucanotransferase